jgi:alkylation response protein AidB-like acyl-CoA dehydrogenase
MSAATMTSTLASVQDLESVILERADEIERLRGIPSDLFDQLRDAGCFRMLVPASYGGSEVSLLESLKVVEAIARADGSTGWTAAIVATTPLVLAFLPAATFDALYSDGPDLVTAGALAPKGRGVRETDGWRVMGKWPFGSVCRHASWIYVNCVVIEDGAAKRTGGGEPEVRMMLLPAAEVEIVDSWHTVGLRGTGSHDLKVEQATCPDERSGLIFGGTPTVPGALFNIPVINQLGLFIAAVALGIAAGAVDELAAQAGKRPAMSLRSLGQSPLFQDRFGSAYMELRAAQALLSDQAQAAWARVASGTALSLLERAALRATAAHVTASAVSVVDAAYTLAGGSSVYDGAPLQRRLRDIHTATQHAVTRPDSYSTVGALLAGEEVDSLKVA